MATVPFTAPQQVRLTLYALLQVGRRVLERGEDGDLLRRRCGHYVLERVQLGVRAILQARQQLRHLRENVPVILQVGEELVVEHVGRDATLRPGQRVVDDVGGKESVIVGQTSPTRSLITSGGGTTPRSAMTRSITSLLSLILVTVRRAEYQDDSNRFSSCDCMSPASASSDADSPSLSTL